MKSKLTALFAGLMMSLAVQATSIDNPVAPLNGEVAQKLRTFEDQMLEEVSLANEKKDLNERVLGFAKAVDDPFNELGYSMDKTILAILKVQDTDVRQANRLRRWGLVDIAMLTLSMMEKKELTELLIDNNYISRETADYWENR